MGSFFKRFKKKNPLTTQKGSPYYVRESMIQIQSDLAEIMQQATALDFVSISKTITFHGVEVIKITPQLLKSKFGTPSHIHDNSDEIEGHKVYYYRDSIDFYKFLLQFHFIDNQFFFASNKISSVTNLSDSDMDKIVNRIFTKYLADKKNKVAESHKLRIKDADGSMLYTLDDVYFHIKYLPGNSFRQSLMKKYADYKAPEAKPSGFKQSLEEYI